MIEYKILYKINICLYSIIVCPNSFFRDMNLNFCLFHYFSTNFLEGMNIFLYSDFAQLFSIGNNMLYTLPVTSKTLVVNITKKTAYDAFTENVMLKEVM